MRKLQKNDNSYFKNLGCDGEEGSEESAGGGREGKGRVGRSGLGFSVVAVLLFVCCVLDVLFCFKMQKT